MTVTLWAHQKWIGHHATATITLSDSTPMLANTVQQQSGNTLALSGDIDIAPSIAGFNATFSIEASGDVCQYTPGTNPQMHKIVVLPVVRQEHVFSGDPMASF